MRLLDRRQTCWCDHSWSSHATGGWACLAYVDDPDNPRGHTCSCPSWEPAGLIAPDMGPCSCQRCEDLDYVIGCPRKAPRDEGSPDVCEDCLRGIHAVEVLA